MNIISIQVGTPAWDELLAVMTHPDTRYVSLSNDGDSYSVKVKQNSYMWSPPLRNGTARPVVREHFAGDLDGQ